MTITLTDRRPAPRVQCQRFPSAEDAAKFNVPIAPMVSLQRTITQHSPDGFEWGYHGSGPADLALQIMADILPPGCDGLPPIRLWAGECSTLAWLLHQDFKRDFIARIPHAGGVIEPDLIDRWLDEHLPAVLDDDDVIDTSDQPSYG